MSEQDRERSGGGRLGRSQTVTVRLDPRLNYLCELAARAQRRTKSSFIEAAIDEAIHRVSIDPRGREESRGSIGEHADQLWHVRDHERLIELSSLAPHLMTFEEQEIWAVICEYGGFWRGRWRSSGYGEEVWEWTTEVNNLQRDIVGSCWEKVVAVAEGRAKPDVLPTYLKRRTVTKAAREPARAVAKDDDELDDEIPF